MELSHPKGLLSFLLLLSTQLLCRAGEATTAATKEVQFSGWKPVGKQTESLSTSEFVEQFSDPQTLNSSDIDTSETKRSFLLVYPPRPSNGQQQQQAEASHQSNFGSPVRNSNPNGQQQSDPSNRNFGPAVRNYPTQPKYQKMMSFGASEGSNRRSPGVYQRSKFPPVANPPPIPPHAGRGKKQLPNFTPDATSRHQVQIQLLDGYLVPPSGGELTANIFFVLCRKPYSPSKC